MTLLTPEDNKSNLEKGNCYICQEEFGDNDNTKQRKVRDHCHYTNKYRCGK